MICCVLRACEFTSVSYPQTILPFHSRQHRPSPLPLYFWPSSSFLPHLFSRPPLFPSITPASAWHLRLEPTPSPLRAARHTHRSSAPTPPFSRPLFTSQYDVKTLSSQNPICDRASFGRTGPRTQLFF
ncbi:hypothetical protein B0H12DRAFT_372321 [Mycena haematopus]|nr:hypothetical protein B0H12DRAFT_372321 [Mycena haematopus]